jgi:hypothetical protein
MKKKNWCIPDDYIISDKFRKDDNNLIISKLNKQTYPDGYRLWFHISTIIKNAKIMNRII